jgi:hypothetical protein
MGAFLGIKSNNPNNQERPNNNKNKEILDKITDIYVQRHAAHKNGLNGLLFA